MGNAQVYEAKWESIDSRPTPQWFKDAKFGIFRGTLERAEL